MNRIRSTWLAVAAAALFSPAIPAQFISNFPADPIVAMIGDGSTIVNSQGRTVTLRHYLNSVANQAVPVSFATFNSSSDPTNRMVASISATSEGNLTNSADFNYVVIAGYDAVNQTANISTTAAANRVVGWAAIAPITGLTGSTATGNSTVMASAYNNNNLRSATALGGPGSDAWTSGTGTTPTAGVRHINSNTALTDGAPTGAVGNTRSLDIYNGQLFVSSGSGAFVGVSSVGTGTPTSGQPGATILISTAGSGTGTASPYEFVLRNDPNGNQSNLQFGVNVAYIADDRSAANGGGIQKWSWNGTAWALDYTLNLTEGARGLAGYLDGSGNAVLFATGATGTTGNRLYQVTDLGVGSSAITLADSTGTNNFFRGVALVSVPEPSVLLLGGVTTITMAGVCLYRRRLKFRST